MKPKQTMLLLFLIPLLFARCDTAEPPGDTLQPGRRDYVWAIDTISSGSFQTYLTSIWGSSSNDVWICGFDSDRSKSIMHFDGGKWSTAQNIPLQSYAISPNIVEGVDANFCVIVGGAKYLNQQPPPTYYDSAMIMKYINGAWNVKSIGGINELWSLSVLSRDNFFVGDRMGNVLRFTGSNFEKYRLGARDNPVIILEALSAQEVYAITYYEKNSPTSYYNGYFLYNFNGSSWTLLDSNISSTNYNRTSIPTYIKGIGRTLYGCGDIGFVKKNGNMWEIITPGIYGQFGGTNEKNIFLGNQDFGVMHYNGQDWYRFEQLPWLPYSGVTVFSNAVFLIASDGSKTFIVKGRLPNG